MAARQPGAPVRGLAIQTAIEGDLIALKALPFSTGLSSKHDGRYARQLTGDVVYLIALDDNEIVSHLLLKWNGPEHPRVRSLIPACAEIEDFMVDPGLRNQGIGAAMLDQAVDRCRERGFSRLGLSVGVANPDARRLYERREFVLVPGSEHRVTWLARDTQGREFVEHDDDCVYLTKELS